MRKLLIIGTVLLIIACSTNKTPKGILTEKEITPILIDLHIADGIYSQRYIMQGQATRDNYAEDLYLSVLKKYKIDRKVLETSLFYYGKHPDIYKPIYDNVLDRLNELNVKIRVKDSIQNKRKM
jgi:hypothetical protein